MDQLIGFVTEYTEKRYQDDFVDRLNFQYTSYVFAISALVIGYNTYFGTAITCWTPAEFRRGWIEYAQDYCLIENTYYIPIDDPDMPPESYREQKELPYYQWVQFFLVLLAALFYLPYLFWSTVNWWTGLQVQAVVKEACQLDKTNEAIRSKQIKKISQHLTRFAGSKSVIPFVPNNLAKHWVAISYAITKLLFVFNLLAQLVLIHTLLGFTWTDFFNLRIGFSSNWISNGIFPRQTMCDFEVRNKGSVQKYSIQCVLSMNMLNEKIFLFLFYWLIVLIMITISNTIGTILSTFRTLHRQEFSRRMLKASGVSDGDECSNSSDTIPLITRPKLFNSDHKLLRLNPDLFVVLQLIAKNAGDNVCSAIISDLFNNLSEKFE